MIFLNFVPSSPLHVRILVLEKKNWILNKFLSYINIEKTELIKKLSKLRKSILVLSKKGKTFNLEDFWKRLVKKKLKNYFYLIIKHLTSFNSV